MHIAARSAPIDVIHYLKRKWALALCAEDIDRRLPLPVAIAEYKPRSHLTKVVDALADDNTLRAKDKDRSLPLYLAAHFAQEDVVEDLTTDHPGALLEKNNDGLRPLNIARQCNTQELAGFFEKETRDYQTVVSSDPHKQDRDGEPPSSNCVVGERVSEADSPSLCGVATLAKQVLPLLLDISLKLDAALHVLAQLDRRINNEVPRLFILLPADLKSGWKRPKSWLRSKALTKFNLFFVCAVSFKPVAPPIKLSVARDWVQKAAPVLAHALWLLQLSMKVGLNVNVTLFDVASDISSFSCEIMSSNIAEMFQELLSSDATYGLETVTT